MACTAAVTSTRFKLVFFAPSAAMAKCKEAIFRAGAGTYPGPGNYTECGFESAGTGQFRPGDVANPHLGKVGQLERVDEIRFETLCLSAEIAKAAVAALKRAHPYEEPAYEVYRLEDF